MPPVELLIVTGPLGSGKTTAVNTLLRRGLGEGHRIALLVNEFGESSIDGALLAHHRAELAGVADLVNGCACCTLREDVIVALATWCNLPPDQRPERIVLETTGLADPTDLVDLEQDPRLAGRLRLMGLLTVLSCLTPPETLMLDALLHRQLSLAGLVHLTNGDVDPAAQATWLALLERDFHGVPVVISHHGTPEGEGLDPWKGDPQSRDARQARREGTSFADARSHSLRLEHPLDPAGLEDLLARHPEGGRLLRAKGVVRFQGHGLRADGSDLWQFQWADWRVDLAPLAWTGSEIPETRAVIIGRGLDSVAWRNAFHALERPPQGARRRLALPRRSARNLSGDPQSRA